MILRNECEVQNTRRKLQRLEALYKARRDQNGGDEELREATMESLKRYINQFKEEIARYECGSRGDVRARPRELQNDVELANTREKLRSLEGAYEVARAESALVLAMRDREFQDGDRTDDSDPAAAQIARHISSITDFDEGVFTALLANSEWAIYPTSYEGSFAFYSHRAGYFPMKYFDYHLLIPFFYRNSRFSILRPLGRWNTGTTVNVARYLLQLSGAPVTFLKLTFDQFAHLSTVPGFTPSAHTRNLQDISDDRYCQLLLHVRQLLASVEDEQAILLGLYPDAHYLRRALRIFAKQYLSDFRLERLEERHVTDVEYVIRSWTSDFRARYQTPKDHAPHDDRVNLVLPDTDDFLVRPYRCLLHRFARKTTCVNNLGFVGYVREQPVGFLFFARTSHKCAALYANIALLQYSGLPYHLVYAGTKEVSRYGITVINLGGQETNMLRRFFLRFHPEELDRAEDRCYEGQFGPEVVQ